MKNRVFAFLIVFSALLCIVAPLAAQDDAGIYYREALWDVKRTHWSSYEENFTKNRKPILDKLFAEGVITEWAVTAESIHAEDGYSHAVWWSGKDLASLQRVIDAFDERDEQLSEAERKKRTAELTGVFDQTRMQIEQILKFTHDRLGPGMRGRLGMNGRFEKLLYPGLSRRRTLEAKLKKAQDELDELTT